MKTYMADPASLQKEWYVVDAEGETLGRLASQVAAVLMGKHKPEYTPSVDTGDYVIVVNTDKVVLTGKKLDQKIYYHHTGYPGGLKETKYRDLMQKKSDFAFREAVRRMLPKNRMGRKMIKKLHLYKGAEHNNQAQCPKALEF
ncbi:MAG: 50S ribosomal protein L13 [Christensenellaceae bacterium]